MAGLVFAEAAQSGARAPGDGLPRGACVVRTDPPPDPHHQWRPDSFYPKIAYNANGKMHTLCLLDIKVKEPDFQAMMRGQTSFSTPLYSHRPIGHCELSAAASAASNTSLSSVRDVVICAAAGAAGAA